MIKGEMRAAGLDQPVEAQMEARGGVRAKLSFAGRGESVTFQLDRVGCVTLVYRHSETSDPKTIFVGFMDELAACTQMATTEIGGTISVE